MKRSNPSCRAQRIRVRCLSRDTECGGRSALFRIQSTAVAPPQCVPAHAEHIKSHANAIAQRMDFRPLIVGPAHRNFHCSEAELFCQIKQFRVKAPALNLLVRENLPRRAAGECLESALGVFLLQLEDKSQKQIEGSAVELA